MKRLLGPLLAVLTLSGCATFVEGQKATTGGEGLRYSLPAPFLMVVPKPDGTLSVSTVMLPDPDNTYSLKTKSFISSYTLDVQLENQMLKSVSLSPKSDAVAAAAVGSLANYRKAKIDAEAKAEEDAKKEDASAAKAIGDAKLALDLANGKVKVLEDNGGSAEKILEAKVAVGDAQIKYDALVKAQQSSGRRMSSADAPGADKGGGPVAAGAMLFRIVPEGKGVKLVAVRGPTMFATATTAMGPAVFSPKGPLDFTDANGVLKREITYGRALSDITSVSLVSSTDVTKPLDLKPTVNVVAGAAPAKITITLAKGTPPGAYGLAMTLVFPDGSTSSELIDVNVVK